MDAVEPASPVRLRAGVRILSFPSLRGLVGELSWLFSPNAAAVHGTVVASAVSSGIVGSGSVAISATSPKSARKLSVSSSCASCSVMPCSPIHLDGRGGSSAFLLLPRSPKLGERGFAWLVSPSSSSVWVPSWMAWVPPKYACCHASSATKVWTAGPIASPPMKGTFTRSPSLSLSLSLGSLSACVL